jgi:thiol:disulfide interchange protein DsbD
MSSLRFLTVLFGACWAVTLAAAAPTSVVTTEQVRAELVAHAPQGAQPGQPIWLGLAIDHQPHWHTYWKNPGDSGLPTNLQWDLPAGVTAGEIEWPTPERLPIGPLVNYGYEGKLLLPVKLTLPPGFNAETLNVKLRGDWLVCREVCIPESGEFALALNTRSSAAAHAARFEAAAAARPQPVAGAQASADVVAEGTMVLRVQGLPAAWQGQPIAFFPETEGVIDNAAAVPLQWQGSEWQARIALSAQRSASPSQMNAVLTTPGQANGVQVAFAIGGTWPAPGVTSARAGATSSESAPATAPATAPAIGVIAAMLLALLGGALLNLMPCVFPVLSLKVLGFATHIEDRRALALGGLAYTLGVVLSFLALAATLLVLRAGGEQLGWGFQLQSPMVVAALATLFTVIGLNLVGLFEFRSVLPSQLASLRLRHPLVDAMLTGVLAVAIAAPCTTPFMGASLGLAATLPAAQALAIFGALGLGMALPYLAASLWPAVGRMLPRPGAWMAQLRTAMAFPMFGTVVWLLWVLGQQTSIDAVAALLSTLVALAFAAWALGAAGVAPRARAVLGTVAIAILAAAMVWTIPVLVTPALAGARGAVAADASQRWQPWSNERVAALRAAGKPVFVDFTAAWCVTCQFNKRTVLSNAEVLADFEARGVVLLRADWTRRDATITAELARLGRNGVPVYVLYAPQATTPKVLSEILSVADVRGALQSL